MRRLLVLLLVPGCVLEDAHTQGGRFQIDLTGLAPGTFDGSAIAMPVGPNEVRFAADHDTAPDDGAGFTLDREHDTGVYRVQTGDGSGEGHSENLRVSVEADGYDGPGDYAAHVVVAWSLLTLQFDDPDFLLDRTCVAHVGDDTLTGSVTCDDDVPGLAASWVGRGDHFR